MKVKAWLSSTAKTFNMATLIFLATILSVFILLIRAIINLIKQKRSAPAFWTIGAIISVYCLLWVAFYFRSSNIPVPLGTDICFDDWCATITKVERPMTLGKENNLFSPLGKFFVLNIRMSNQARGIAQKPSEPRVHIVDGKGKTYSFSRKGQEVYENEFGKQFPIDERLELHQTLETKLVFDIPKDANNIYALIEEGPFVTRLLLKYDTKVFLIDSLKQ